MVHMANLKPASRTGRLLDMPSLRVKTDLKPYLSSVTSLGLLIWGRIPVMRIA